MAVGANGASGAHVLRITAAYKQGQGNVRIQSQSMVENLAGDIKEL